MFNLKRPLHPSIQIVNQMKNRHPSLAIAHVRSSRQSADNFMTLPPNSNSHFTRDPLNRLLYLSIRENSRHLPYGQLLNNATL